MKKLIINTGISGSGKSTHIKQLETEYSSIYTISSDNLRLQMFGSLIDGNNKDANQQVWRFINENFLKYFDEFDTVVLDATNINLKRRKFYYNEFKRKFKDGIVENHFFFCTPDKSLKNQSKRTHDEFVPKHIVENQFINLQIPIVNVDCDIIIPFGQKWFKNNINVDLFLDETMEEKDTKTKLYDLFALVKDEHLNQYLHLNFAPHDSKYHLESIDEHIVMVIDEMKRLLVELDDVGDQNFLLASIFHDLGKGYVKDRNGNNLGQYIGHDNVGAQYLANLILFNDDFEKYYQAVLICYFHMTAHQINNTFTEKSINKFKNKYKVDDDFVNELKTFAKIDSKARVPQFEKSELYQIRQEIIKTLNDELKYTRTNVIPNVSFTYTFENEKVKVTGFNGLSCSMYLTEDFETFSQFEEKYLKNYFN